MKQKLFRLVLPILALLFGSACGGGHGGTSGTPVIANFILSPTTLIQNSGGGTATVNLNLTFSDTDGDLTTLRFTSGTQSIDSAVSWVQGKTTGTIEGSFTAGTTRLGAYTIQVQALDAKNQLSNSLSATFQVTLPPPTLVAINPESAQIGASGLILQVSGTGFVADSSVLWNGQPRATTYLSATVLQAQLNAGDLAVAATAQVSVLNPGFEGGTSNALAFPVGSMATRVMNLTTNDLLWDSRHQVLYASVASSDATNPDAIAVLDPVAGSVVTAMHVGSNPGRLALSDDGQFLYVALNGSPTILRLGLPALNTDLVIPLGHDSFSEMPYFGLDLAVAPGAPHTLAVTLGLQQSPSASALVVFDDATPRSGTLQGAGAALPLYDSLQWGADASILYAANSEDNRFDYFIIGIGPGGPTLTADLPFAMSGYTDAIHYEATTALVYSDSGQVLVPGTGVQVGNFQTVGPMVPDGSLQRAFFLDDPFGGTGPYTLRCFNLTQFTLVGMTTVTPVGPGGGTPPNRLIRWGTNGLALGGKGNPVYLLSGPFVTGN